MRSRLRFKLRRANNAVPISAFRIPPSEFRPVFATARPGKLPNSEFPLPISEFPKLTAPAAGP